MNWKEIKLGEKVIVGSSVLAILSLFLKWVDAGIISVNGFQQQGYLFLILFIYPLYCIFKRVELKPIVGYLCSGIGIVGAIAFISSKTVDFFGQEVNFASTGLYVLLIAFAGLGVGVFLSHRHSNQEKNIVETVESIEEESKKVDEEK